MPKIIIASGPVIVENNKVLLDKDYKEDIWKFCGGKIQENESLIETAKRRSKEELGIEIEILDEKPFLLHTKKETPEGNFDVILVHFLAKRIGEIIPGEDIRKWDWLNINNLPEDLAPNILPTLKHFGFIK
ncbi:MAG: NUDIX hydrolase [bacterium]|nr:NUDIX hydrolase [bacterium]